MATEKAIWLKVLVLVLIGFLGFFSRLFSVIRFESIIHEFDPWFNYRTTRQLVEHGYYDFVNWFDELSWYPLGRVVGGTVYPGIMVTAGLIHFIINKLNFPVDIREVCVFLAPLFSAFTAYATYLLTSEMKDSSAGLLAAIFVAVAPGYISRSVAGSYDNEGIAIFLLMIDFYFWIKALKTGSTLYASVTAFFYFYMVSAWGGYVFIINLIPLHVLTLMLMGRFSSRIYVAYSTFYVIGTLSSMQIPFVGFQPTRTSEHMAALGVFGLVQIVSFVQLIKSHMSEKLFKSFFRYLVLGTVVSGFAALILLSTSGYIAPWTGRFYSLWDTGYAKKYIPIIASVSEHQPTAWPSFFFDLQILIVLLPAGIFYCFRELKDEHVFIILYAVSASYFAGVMVRLMLTLTPVVCVAAAISFSNLFDTYLTVNGEADATSSLSPTEESVPSPTESTSTPAKSNLSKSQLKSISKKITVEKIEKIKKQQKPRQSKSESFFGITRSGPRILVMISIAFILWQFVWHSTWVTSNAYSSPSVVLASKNADGSQLIIDDFREAYYWLRQNSDPKSKIMAWWDYGYQITGMANRTVLVDNNTWNNTHIATVGKAMACSEDVSYEIMRKHDVDYVLVIVGAAIGYSGDDINKFLWMIRIGEGVYPKEVSERKFFTNRGEYRVDENATPTMKNSLMYKMSYYRFSEMFGGGQAFDRVRQSNIPKTPIKLTTLDEAYTTENMIVRIYQVKKPDNLGRSMNAAATFGKKRSRKAGRSVGSSTGGD